MSTANEIDFDYQNFLKHTPTLPGVYRMYDERSNVIYVGKAKDLKKRLASYFRKNLASRKTTHLVQQIQHIELTITETETEALLLEHNYIKKYQPKYNVLLRDDKSYPYILLSHDVHPRLSSYRGSKQSNGDYFGPYPNSSAVKHTLNLLQQMFPIRQCENNVYRNRSRPCLQYQIKRCLGPCVKGLVTDQTYHENVNYVKLFLQGHNEQVITHLVDKMDQASEGLHFEQAAKYRDLIQAVRHTSTQQIILSSYHDLDVIGIATANHLTTIHLLFIRQGKVLGSRNYYPKVPINTELDEVLETFLGQFYLQANLARTLPQEILINYTFKDPALAHAIHFFTQGKTQLNTTPSKEAKKYIKLATINAFNALQTKLQTRSSMEQRYQELEKTLNLHNVQRIECFDISHHQGEQTVASCVVFDRNGPITAQYRRYLIKGITLGDDYAAMRNVLRRRYNKALLDDKVPDLIVIDGGKAQLAQAITIFEELNVSWDKNKPLLLGIAKGVDRKAGLETLYTAQLSKGVALPSYSLALHLLQHIRDESHRHAISGHRNRMSMAKIKNSSILETIPGIGAKRRQALLKNLGGLKPLLDATIEDIAKVPTISHKLAEKIYHALKS